LRELADPTNHDLLLQNNLERQPGSRGGLFKTTNPETSIRSDGTFLQSGCQASNNVLLIFIFDVRCHILSILWFQDTIGIPTTLHRCAWMGDIVEHGKSLFVVRQGDW
jgi:hypothetical protein